MTTADAGHTGGASRLESLTERENEILACLAQGMTNREIGETLHLAVTTVKWYTRQIYNKLGVNSRREAAVFAQDNGLFSVSITHRPDNKHNLPADTTPFIGRQHEIQTISGLLKKQNHRLITILAPGGMGKSRLAIQVARQQLDNFADGVFFVPLQPLSAPDQIVIAIGECIGFVFLPNAQTPEQQLLDHLKNRTMLLVLDNYEHLLAGAHHAMRMLQYAPSIKLLITSRERINVMSETVIQLYGLAYQRNGVSTEAADLFINAVKRLTPTFDAQGGFRQTIDRICELTEGMPLALLLAAGWSDSLTLAQIAEEIEQCIGFLEQDKSDLPYRHRGIRAVFEPTWERLHVREQAVLARLSVFAGGCTYDAAKHITGATPHILQSLINKALVIHTTGGRYEMHELLRQYAEEKLEQLFDIEQTKQLHAEYYSQFLAKYGIELRNPSTQKLFPHEIDNLRTMWYHFVDTQQWEYVEHLAIGMRWLYEFYGLYHESVHWFQSAIDGIHETQLHEQNPRLYGVLLAVLCASRKDIDHPEMENTTRQALKVLDSVSLNVAASHATTIAHTQLVNLLNAGISDHIWQSRFERVIPVFDRADERQGLCVAYILLTIEDHVVHQDLDRAREHAEKALAYAYQTDDLGAIAWASGTLAYVAFRECHYEAALDLLIKQCENFSAINKKRFLNHVMSSIGYWSAIVGDFDQAYKYFEMALQHDRQIEWVFDEVRHALDLSKTYLLDDRPSDCKETLEYTKSLLEQIKQHSSFDVLSIIYQQVLSLLHLYGTEYTAAFQVAETALQQCKCFEEQWAKDLVPHLHHIMGQALIQMNRIDEAQEHFAIALRASSAMHTMDVLEILLSSAAVFNSTKQSEIVSFVANHPAATYTHRKQAKAWLKQLSSRTYRVEDVGTLPPSQDLEQLVTTIIKENTHIPSLR